MQFRKIKFLNLDSNLWTLWLILDNKKKGNMKKILVATPRFEPGTLELWDQHADHYTIRLLIWKGDKEKKNTKTLLNLAPAGRGHFELLRSPRNPKWL